MISEVVNFSLNVSQIAFHLKWVVLGWNHL